MKATAKNIAKYANDKMDGGACKSNNISIGLPGLNKNTLDALRNNYNFKSVSIGPFGYIRFER